MHYESDYKNPSTNLRKYTGMEKMLRQKPSVLQILKDKYTSFENTNTGTSPTWYGSGAAPPDFAHLTRLGLRRSPTWLNIEHQEKYMKMK